MTGKTIPDPPHRIQLGASLLKSEDLAGLSAETPGSQSGFWEKIFW